MSAPAFITSETSSPSRAKSAESIDGASFLAIGEARILLKVFHVILIFLAIQIAKLLLQPTEPLWGSYIVPGTIILQPGQ